MRREKLLLLEEIKDQLQDSGSFVVTRYQGLTGSVAYSFRREIAKTGGYFEVVSKRMLIQAANQLNISFDIQQLSGHIGLVLNASDPMVAVKTVVDFAKKNEKSVQLVGAYLDGTVTSEEEVNVLATLPTKDQLRAELLGLFMAPATGVVGAMNALLTGVVRCVDSRATTLES